MHIICAGTELNRKALKASVPVSLHMPQSKDLAGVGTTNEDSNLPTYNPPPKKKRYTEAKLKKDIFHKLSKLRYFLQVNLLKIDFLAYPPP